MSVPPQFHACRYLEGPPHRGNYITRKPKNEETHYKDVSGHKPQTALWTSTYTPEAKHPSAWVEWCTSEMPVWITGKSAYIIYPKVTARVYVIDDADDVRYLSHLFPGTDMNHYKYGRTSVNWVAVAKVYDAVRLTDNGQYETRFPYDQSVSLYGWDVESTAWFRHVFDKVEPYTRPLMPELK